MSEWEDWFDESIKNSGSLANYIWQAWIYNRDLIYDLTGNRIKPPATVLELGCGSGLEIMAPFAAKGYKVTGVDMNKKMLDFAKSNFEALRLKGDFLLSDMFKFNPGKKFDLVISQGVIEHFSKEDMVKALSVHKKLSKKFVVFTVPTKYQIKHEEGRKVKAPDWIPLDFGDLFELAEKAGLTPISKIAYGDVVNTEKLTPAESKEI
ncbi:class I SAM-dependent methyltransferase, partial [Candidatus Woesearchaeota archaeon]|nr:class I SAM-dependent methyltransferase [Candidatus Woesearchaeota archaeon]